MMAWGIEVPGGSKAVTVTPDEGTHLHLSQVALGHQPKDNERAVISVEHEDKKWVIGTLVKGRTDHFQLDLVFDREFKLSNTGSTGVFVVGYESFESTLASSDEEDMGTEEEDAAKEIKDVRAKIVSKIKDDKKDVKEKEGKDKSKAVADSKAVTKENGKPAKAEPTAAAADVKDAKKAAKVAAPSPVKTSDEEDDSDDEMEEDSEDEEFEDEDDEDEDDEDEEDEDEDDDEDEESDEEEDSDDTPVKPVVVGKKRPNPAGGTPKSEKKAKVAQETPTPKKDGKGKKDKSEGKDKSAVKDTPPSKKPFTCSDCKGKSFVNESALQAHKKAKHS